MSKKKALLVMAGGRAVSDVLTLFWVKPQVVRVITSQEGWGYKDAFIDIAQSMGCEVDMLPAVDAYDFDACIKACQNACELGPNAEWEWSFSIGSSPKIAGIAAYEVAKQKGISCWHADAQRDHAIPLIKPVPIDNDKFFHLTLNDYMQIQHRTRELRGEPDYRNSVRKWAKSASKLANSLDAREFLSILYKEYKKLALDQEFSVPLNPVTLPLLKSLEDEGLLKLGSKQTNNIVCSFVSQEAARFIGTGDWLEFYVWHEIISTGLADEKHCQWGCEIKDGPVDKEFDLMFMYKAQLIVAECKSERDLFNRDPMQNPFRGMKDYLGDFEAKANVLGGSYVSKLFITNQPAVGASYQSFKDRAHQYKIVLVTGEDLHHISKIIENEAKKPTYPRI